MEYSIETLNLTKEFEKKAKSEATGLKGFLSRLRPKKEKIVAVDHLNIKIRKGELFGLLGPNGAGKTTTIKMLCTLLVPTKGTALVNGYDVVKEAEKVRESLGAVLGGERSLYWRLTGRENLWFFSQLYNIPPDIAKKRIDDLLKLVQLENREDDLVEKYSKGMKQRLHIARGLINDPPILLDEPTLGLDPASARAVREFIKEELNKEKEKTILLTTHYMEEADQLCDRVAIIDYGKIIALDTPENLKKTVQEVEIFEIDVLGAHQGIESLLKDIKDVSNVVVEYHDMVVGEVAIKIHTKSTEEVLPDVTESLIKTGARIRAFKESKPTLEDVFIAKTERRLRE